MPPHAHTQAYWHLQLQETSHAPGLKISLAAITITSLLCNCIL